jgi:hypothetical protein
MRVTVGTIAVLGLAVTVAVAQPPVKERAATLKPPEAIPAGELPIARGAIDDFPATSLPSTPVTRTNNPAARPGVATGPAWLTGADPNVRPAGSIGTSGAGVRPLSPPMTDDPPPAQPKVLDRIRNAVTGEKQPAPQPLPHQVMQQQPQPQPQQQPQPTAATPFRGTGANGAPVYAGPPAYRWYGWGTVTPGANPLAPTGQYPKASANWYNITGATPGAFPVPVGSPARVPSGTEPPSYGLAARAPTTLAPVVPVSNPQPAPPSAIQYTERPHTLPVTPPAESKFMPGPGIGAVAPPPPGPVFMPPPAPALVSVPVITPPPLHKPVVVAPPPPVLTSPPALLPPPAMPKPEPVATLPLPPVVTPAPVAPLPLPRPALPVAVAPPVTPAPVAEPVKLPMPVIEPKPVGVPGPLPTSVVPNPPREELQWQQSKEPATPAPGTWAPAPGSAPLPTMPPEEATGAPVGRAPIAPVVARGQMGDKTPDPIGTLIKQVCQSRAEGVEIRWTGTKKLQVCFEIRTAAEAQKLVNDISRRPELTAYQIDFCVLVK